MRESEPVRYFANPLLSDPARESEPPNVLESATWLLVLEDMVRDAINVLRSEECSVRGEAVVRKPVSVLNIEECFARREEKPNDPDRALGKLLISEPATDIEPVSAFERDR